MRLLVGFIFLFILCSMIVVTSWASLHENVFSAISRLITDPWVVATLFDAYFGFLVFFLWVCYKEKSLLRKGTWFVLIMLFGNIAMAIYVLGEILRIKDNFTTHRLLSEKKG